MLDFTGQSSNTFVHTEIPNLTTDDIITAAPPPGGPITSLWPIISNLTGFTVNMHDFGINDPENPLTKTSVQGVP